MKYHIIINGYLKDFNRQTKELYGFVRTYLSGMETGEAFLLCKDQEKARKAEAFISGEVCVLLASEYSPEAVTKELVKRMESQDIYIFGSDYAGAELSVRTAKRAGGCSVTSVHGCEHEDNEIYVRKMTYSNHMEATFRMKKGPFCISMAKGMEQAENLEKSMPGTVQEIWLEAPSFIVSSSFEMEENTEELKDAKVIIAAGRGAKSKENVINLTKAAECLGGEVGISRPAAMNAWAPMCKLIGVSGAMLSPEICITAGVSGAAAFYAGIEKSKFIVAINTDENAPIMKKADVAIVDDFVPVLDAISKMAKE